MTWRTAMCLLTFQSLLTALAGETNILTRTNSPAETDSSVRADKSGTTNANAQARNNYESFRIIAQRNIFNPNRSSRASRGGENGEARKEVKTDWIALVGTMLYEKGELAFFDGY